MKAAQRGTPFRRGSLLLEICISIGLASFLALFVLRSSLLAIASNQWIVMQTLTDAFMSGETALATRVPFAELEAAGSTWPAQSESLSVPIELGKITGGRVVSGNLRRFRSSQNIPDGTGASIILVRLQSVLTYRVGERQYMKTRSTVRTQ